MLSTVNDEPTLWDSILPAELLVLPAKLERVDAVLDDPVFFAACAGPAPRRQPPGSLDREQH